MIAKHITAVNVFCQIKEYVWCSVEVVICFFFSPYFQSFNESFPQLDDLIDQVNKRIANLSQALDELTPSVNMASNYSEQLRKQADDLEDLLKDIDFARKAVNASKRYSDIVDALNESLAIAQEAEEIAMDARDKVPILGQFWFPGNHPPTPSLSQHYHLVLTQGEMLR